MATANFDFSGRRVLVTGGGQGIGKAIALRFLEFNAHVIVLDKDENLLSQLTLEYPAIQTVAVDLRDWEATRKAVTAVLPIHHLANNAGILHAVPFLKAGLDHINTIFDVNFKGAFNVAQVVAQGMIDHKIRDGSIVNTSSIGDTAVTTGVAVYCAMKAALTMLTRTMAVELGPHRIRVNSIRPGLVNTELVQNAPAHFKEAIKPVVDRMVFDGQETIECKDIADSVVFLSSGLADRITGASLTIDEGYTIQ